MNWGCEYIDDGNYGSVSPPPPVRRFILPRRFVAGFADPQLVSQIRQETSALSNLSTSIAEKGVLFPLEIKVDPKGQGRLKDGYHRLIVAGVLDLADLPVKITHLKSPMTRGHRQQMVMKELLPFLEDLVLGIVLL